MEIEFEDSKELSIRFYSIVINVSKINEVFGSVYDFCKQYDITGTTNGELLIIYFMSYPDDDLVSDILDPIGLKYERDYVFAQEELVYGVGNRPSSNLNHPLSSFDNISWIGSILRKDGNWVWRI